MSGPNPVRLSVVLPVCDNERFVEAAVRSILTQSLAPDELIIGDDGSCDGTSAVVADLARENAVIRLVRREQRSGLANAANWVVGEARGQFVALAHADDLSLPHRLERQLEAIEKRPDAVLVGAPAIGIDPSGKAVHAPDLWRLRHPTVFAPFAHSSVLFRRQAFLDAGGYRAHADYWEDLDLFWRMARIGRILVLPRPVSAYRYSDDSFRARDKAAGVEAAIQYMYDRAGDAGAGDVEAAFSRRAVPAPARVRPRVFIARSWAAIWCGRRPRTFRRMLRRARLRPDGETVMALLFVGGGSVAPRTMRRALQLATRVRSRIAARHLPADEAVEWRPFQSEERG